MVDSLPRIGEFRPQLDSLRAIAVAGVIISHTVPQHTLLLYVRPGDRGVQLFFVLSGFLISGILFKVIQVRGIAALRPFFIRRVLRLLPLFYIVLAATAVVSWDDLKHSWQYHALYLSNYYFFQIGGWQGYVSHFWSLALEEQFYLFWPLVLVVLPPRNWWIGISGLFVLGIGTRCFIEITGRWHEFGVGMYPSYYADDFGGGAAIALWLMRNPSVRTVRRLALISSIVGIVILLTISVALGPVRAANSALNVSAWMMICVGLILSCYVGFDGRLGKWIECRPLTIVGRISYGVYLWHMLAILAAQWLLSALGIYAVLGRFDWIATLFVTTIISVALAGLSWFFIESRLLELKRRFPYSSPASRI